MGGAIGGQGDASAIPKEQLIRTIKRARKLLLRKLLICKRENIAERMQYYKIDSSKYREVMMNYMRSQPQIMQGAMMEACAEEGLDMTQLSAAMQSNMMDPELQREMGKFQTVSGDMCKGQPIPEDCDLEKFKHVMRLQIEEFKQYTIDDPSASFLAQIAASDEIHKVFGIDEIQLGALGLKFENETDPELLELKDRWNDACKIDMLTGQQQEQQHNHSHQSRTQEMSARNKLCRC